MLCCYRSSMGGRQCDSVTMAPVLLGEEGSCPRSIPGIACVPPVWGVYSVSGVPASSPVLLPCSLYHSSKADCPSSYRDLKSYRDAGPGVFKGLNWAQHWCRALYKSESFFNRKEMNRTGNTEERVSMKGRGCTPAKLLLPWQKSRGQRRVRNIAKHQSSVITVSMAAFIWAGLHLSFLRARKECKTCIHVSTFVRLSETSVLGAKNVERDVSSLI